MVMVLAAFVDEQVNVRGVVVIIFVCACISLCVCLCV